MKLPQALFIVGLICCAGWSLAQPAAPKPQWHNDWPTAQRIAKQAKRPIFAVLVCKH